MHCMEIFTMMVKRDTGGLKKGMMGRNGESSKQLL